MYGAAAKTHMDKLDAALRISLRTILGAMKSTPTEILYSELGIEPTALHREWLATSYALRLGHKPLHVAYASTRADTIGSSSLTQSHTPCHASGTRRAHQADPRAITQPPGLLPSYTWQLSPPPWQLPLTSAFGSRAPTMTPFQTQQQHGLSRGR